MNPVQAAKRVLELYWDYNIPVDVQKIANSMNISVNFQPILEGGNDISGRLDINDNGHAICSIRNTDTKQRQRFTLAHELGHFILNHGNSFRDNEASFMYYHYDKREVDANAFAGELLMPEIAVNHLIQKEKENDISNLANAFDVSIPAMKYRLYKLGWLQNY